MHLLRMTTFFLENVFQILRFYSTMAKMKGVVKVHIFQTKNFLKFMISYIFVLFIPLTIIIYSYFHVTETIERNVIDANVFKLESFRNTMDDRIAQIDRVVFDLSINNENFRRVLELPIMLHNSPQMYWFRVARDDFNRLSSSVAEEDRSFMFLRGNNNVVYGRNFFSPSFSHFYSYHFQFGYKTGEEFWNFLFANRYFSHFMPMQHITFLDSHGYYIPYVFSLPAVSRVAGGDTEHVWGTVVYLFNAEKLLNLMAGSLDSYGGQTFLLYGDNVLASTGYVHQSFAELNISRTRGISVEEILWNGERTLAIHISSNYNMLSFLTFLPIDVIHSDMNRIRNMVITLFAIVLLVGLVISATLSYRNTLPVTQLLDSNTHLQQQLKEQRISIEALYVNKLLKNDFRSATDLELSLSHVGLTFGEVSYRVILFRILPAGFIASGTHMQDWEMHQAFLQSLIAPQFKTHTLNHNELAVIASFEREDNIEDIIRTIQKEFNAQFGFAPICGIGEEYQQSEIHYSMQEALAAVDFSELPSASIIWYRDITLEDSFELFGKDHEQIRLNFIRQGDEKAVSEHLDSIYHGAAFRSLSPWAKQLYLSHLHTSLMRISDEIKFPMRFRELERKSAEKPDVYFAALKSNFLSTCAQLKISKKGRKEKLKESILAYVNEHFNDSNLNVAMIATHFNVAENYFSQFFSEQVGETFSRYLERIRLEYSCTLLTDASLTIDHVAALSGYGNTNTFRRAFKRFFGTTPSEYTKV